MKLHLKKGAIAALAACGLFLTLTAEACTSDADRASENLSKAADNFEINRRIVVVNGITDKNLLLIEGLCSIGNNDSAGKVTVTCKTGPSEFKKHTLVKSDNVFLLSEQLEPAKASVYHYRVILKPENIIPDLSVQTS